MKRKTFYQQKAPKKQRGRRNKLFRQMYDDDDKRLIRVREPSELSSVSFDPND